MSDGTSEVKSLAERQVESLGADLDRMRSVVHEAHERLARSFFAMRSEVDEVLDVVEGTMGRIGGSDSDNALVNVPQATLGVLEAFVDNIVDTSRASMQVVRIVDDMGEHAATVQGLLQEINGITELTNILAINATIEAARAGAAGRGFEVVASEVRSLSRQTARFSEAIGDALDLMNRRLNEVREAVRALASRDMSFAIEAKGKAAGMLEEMKGTTAAIQETMRQTAHRVERHKQSVSEAIVGLQFEDIVQQKIRQAEQRLGVIATAVEQGQRGEGAHVEAGDVPHIRSVVPQESLSTGSIELF